MCLGIPGKVIALYTQDGIAMGKVDFSGIIKEVCLAYVPEIAIAEYVIVHVGFAITRLDQQSAHETLQVLEALGTLGEELHSADSTPIDVSAPS